MGAKIEAIDVLAVDPSLTSTGFCLFNTDCPAPKASGYISSQPGYGLGKRFEAVVTKLRSAVSHADIVVIELMEIYPGQTPGNPNKLLEIGALSGMIAGSFRCEAVFLRPKTWKGQLKKKQTWRQLAKQCPEIVAELPDIPKSEKSKFGDVWDAACLGAWYLGGLKWESR